MTKRQQVFVKCGQGPWLENLTRAYLRDGTLARVVLGALDTNARRLVIR